MMAASNKIKGFYDLRKVVSLIKTADDTDNLQFDEYFHFLPEFPEWLNKNLTVLEDGKEYRINVFKYSCTCNEKKARNKEFKKGELRGLCPHIINKILHTKASTFIDEQTTLLLKEVNKNYPLLFYKVMDNFHTVVCISNSKWVNVITTAKVDKTEMNDTFGKYSFDKEKQRWAYNIKPFFFYEIEEIFTKIFV